MANTNTTEKTISKEHLSKLISKNDPCVACQKPKPKDNLSKLWAYFSIVHFQNIEQDYVICDSCKSLISYKAATGTGDMQKHVDSCGQTTTLLDEHNETRITKYFSSKKK